MPWLIVYLIKCSLTLACLYLFYLLVLRPLTFYRWNRFYLLGYSLLSFLLPFVDITPLVEREGYGGHALVNAIPAINSIADAEGNVTVANPGRMITSCDMVITLFISGVLIMFFRFLMQWLSLQRVKRSAAMIRQDDIWLYDVRDSIHPFSFGRDIFINSAHHSDEELKKIIQHEFVHVKQQHSIDLIIAELLCILNWYNPFAWLIRKAIRDNLEFIADNQVLESGTDAQQYQLLLLKVMGLPQYSITNQFGFSSLKKRIAMMNKLRSAQVHLVKFLFLLPLCAVILLAFRNKEIEERKQEEVAKAYQQPAAKHPLSVKQVQQTVVEKSALSVTDLDDDADKDYSALSFPRSDVDMLNDTPPPGIIGDQSLQQILERLPGIQVDKSGRMALRGESLQKVFVDGKEYLIGDPFSPAKNLLYDTVPVSPVPPFRQTKQLPEGVKSISIGNNRATVTYKNGKVEKYNFESEREKGEFDERFGDYAPPPPPVPPLPSAAGRAVPPVPPTPVDAPPPVPPTPIAPQPPALPSGVASMNVTNDKIILRFKNGNTETYDMKNGDQKAAYYRKYGKFPTVPQTPAVPKVPAQKPNPPSPPAKVETNGVEQSPAGTSYIMSKEEGDEMKAAALKRGELYIGIDNPLNALFNNLTANQVMIEWAGGNIFRRADGIYIARPTRQGLSQMHIYKIENNARGQLIKSIQLNTKRLPDPTRLNETLKKEYKKPISNRLPFLPTRFPWVPAKDNC
jgi:beta-lactamase regulating signal transducer with metallopeptidase domain